VIQIYFHGLYILIQWVGINDFCGSPQFGSRISPFRDSRVQTQDFLSGFNEFDCFTQSVSRFLVPRHHHPAALCRGRVLIAMKTSLYFYMPTGCSVAWELTMYGFVLENARVPRGTDGTRKKRWLSPWGLISIAMLHPSRVFALPGSLDPDAADWSYRFNEKSDPWLNS
jgi:hypothetical protein